MRTLKDHHSVVTCVCVSNDGRYIVSGSNVGEVQVWSFESGECLASIHGHNGDVASVSISLDGKYVVSRSSDGSVCVWSLLYDEAPTIRTMLIRKWASSPEALSFNRATLFACTGITPANGRLIKQLGGEIAQAQELLVASEDDSDEFVETETESS